MTFGQPQFLVAFLLVPLALVAGFWLQQRRNAALHRLGNPVLVRRLCAAVNWSGRRWQGALWLLALTLLILALARPQWGSKEEIVEQEGIQVMVALDVSKSMLAQDVKPDRLRRAKMEIVELMNRLEGDEIGLVLFAGASFVQFPLTSDYDTARAFLDNANPGVISRPGTAIDEAIRTAMNSFDEQRDNQKVIIIMTDGEGHEGDPLAAAQEAAAEDILIYTLGFGSPQGVPVPEVDRNGQYIGDKVDANGNPVLTRLDETTLQQIAQAAGGRYYRASAGGDELDALRAEMATLQTAALQSRVDSQMVERYQLFVLLALVALLIAEFIPERVRRTQPRAATQPFTFLNRTAPDA